MRRQSVKFSVGGILCVVGTASKTITTPSASALPLYNKVLVDVVVTRHVICSVTTAWLDDIQWRALGGGGLWHFAGWIAASCLCLPTPCCLPDRSRSQLYDVIGSFHSFIHHSLFYVLRQVRSLFQSEFSTECDLLLRLYISSLHLCPQGNTVSAYVFLLVFQRSFQHQSVYYLTLWVFPVYEYVLEAGVLISTLVCNFTWSLYVCTALGLLLIFLIAWEFQGTWVHSWVILIRDVRMPMIK